MTSWFLKECPKCGGDLYLDPLGSGDMVKCLQCGLEVKLSFLFIQAKSARQENPDVKAPGAAVKDKQGPAIRK